MSHSITTIRKIGILVSIFFITLASASAETGNRRNGFSFSPLLGFLYGQAEELVFEHPGSELILSELLWDLRPMVYFGVAANFGPQDPFRDNGFIAAGSFRFGLPFRSGFHENRDWLGRPNHNMFTHFSQHDVFIQNAILADISAGHSWRLSDNLALGAYAKFSFKHFSWSGENGFIQYPVDNAGNFIMDNAPPWNIGLPMIPLFGKVIRYSQSWFIFSPGLSLTWKIDSLFSLRGSFSYTPLIYCVARDDHLLRMLTFWDYVSGGHFFNGAATFVVSPRGNLDFSLSVSYTLITGSRGRTYTTHTFGGPVGPPVPDSAGAGLSVFDITLGATMRVGRN